MSTNITPDLESLAAQLSELKVRHEAAEAEISTLEEQLHAQLSGQLARGTRNSLGGKAADAVKAAQKRSPWYVGDDGPTPDLIAAIAGACTEAPRGHAEIVELTGARPGRVSGALVEMRRGRMPLVNIGTEKNKAIYWFVTPDHAARATNAKGGNGGVGK